MIVPFGDSHCCLFGGTGPGGGSLFPDTPEVHWLGPAKVWGLVHKSVNRTREKFAGLLRGSLSSPDVLPIAAFGEIDIRVNLGRRCAEVGNFSPIAGLVNL
jgi:hypothetical protein